MRAERQDAQRNDGSLPPTPPACRWRRSGTRSPRPELPGPAAAPRSPAQHSLPSAACGGPRHSGPAAAGGRGRRTPLRCGGGRRRRRGGRRPPMAVLHQVKWFPAACQIVGGGQAGSKQLFRRLAHRVSPACLGCACGLRWTNVEPLRAAICGRWLTWGWFSQCVLRLPRGIRMSASPGDQTGCRHHGNEDRAVCWAAGGLPLLRVLAAPCPLNPEPPRPLRPLEGCGSQVAAPASSASSTTSSGHGHRCRCRQRRRGGRRLPQVSGHCAVRWFGRTG